ncbi:MAG: T9SS type A sorting domain-containing protein [Lacibacter sp.]
MQKRNKTRKPILYLLYATLCISGGCNTAVAAELQRQQTPPVISVFGAPLLLAFGYTPAGTETAPRDLFFSAGNVPEPLQVTAPVGFELSKDGTNFVPTISYQPAELLTAQRIWVRFRPTRPHQGFGGSIRFSTGSYLLQAPDVNGTSLHPEQSLDVVNWNLAWFGGNNGPVDDDLQVELARIVMDSLGADLYMLQEIVDTARLGRLSRSLQNGPYDYVVAPYASNTSTPANGTWRTAQKLAYVYKRNMFANISTRAFTNTSTLSENRYNWASGRFPFLMEAHVTIDGVTKRVVFVNIHAKAESGLTSDYFRRLGAAGLMYDSLNAVYPTQHVLIAGDYNDDLDETISTVAGTTLTPYHRFMEDPARYEPISYWNTLRGENSYIGYPNVIDHAIVSNEMQLDYVPFSCIIRREAINWVPDYRNNLTDHLPVVSRFNWRQSATNLVTRVREPEAAPGNLQLLGMPGATPVLLFKTASSRPVTLQVFNPGGQLLWQQQLSRVAAGQQVQLPLQHLPAGLYYLQVQTGNSRHTLKLIR